MWQEWHLVPRAGDTCWADNEGLGSREAKLEDFWETGSYRLRRFQGYSGALLPPDKEPIAEFRDGHWTEREVHMTSPPDGGHVPSCSQATSLEGGGEVPVDWRSQANQPPRLRLSMALWATQPWPEECKPDRRLKGRDAGISKEIFTDKQVIWALLSLHSQWNLGHV